MARVPGWFVAALLTAGFSAAMLVGAGIANAETGSGPQTRTQSQDAKPAHSFGVKSLRAARDSSGDPARRASLKPSSSDSRPQFGSTSDRKLRLKLPRVDAAPDQSTAIHDAVEVLKLDRNTGLSQISKLVAKSTKSVITQRDSSIVSIETEAEDGAVPQLRERVAALGTEVRNRLTSLIGAPRAPSAGLVETGAVAAAAPAPAPSTRIRELAEHAGAALNVLSSAGVTATVNIPEIAAAPSGPVLGPGESDSPAPVRLVGGAAFDFVAVLIHVTQGPPTVPPALRDSVEVSSSTLVIAPGHEVEANWYIPTTAENEAAPDRFIYLQHGFLASGPMYSYTAAYLAERTNSIVVTTTLTSNPFAEDGMWLGGDNMHYAVAQLFLDEDRQALNASLTTAALKAGRDDVVLPQRFVLIGHSLGGGFAPGVAGYYAEGLVAKREADPNTAHPNQLAGVILYDAVPVSPILPNAMARLKVLENYSDNPADPDDIPDAADYIPVYEIGAPDNFLNSTSNVNEELSAARPGQFVGVVLEGGVHMDSMQGGNPLIQLAAYLVAGFPQPQNPPAVQELSVGWIEDMFEGKINPATGKCDSGCQGIYGDPGESLAVITDAGTATAVVIDSTPAVQFTGITVGRPVLV